MSKPIRVLPCAVVSLLCGLISLGASPQTPNDFIVASGVHDVGPGKFRYFPMIIPTQLRNGRVAGNAYASGGAGNDIRVMVLRERDLIGLSRNNPITPLFDSGQRRSIVLSVPIAESGTYFVVIDNRFSILSTKRVSVDIRLVFDALDVEGEKQAQEKLQQRHRHAALILGKLTESLQRMEKQWGTRQVSPPINLAIDNDPAVNAFANWPRKTIILLRGFIDFAESNSSKTDDVMAGLLGHELAHIFYRHGFGNESGEVAESTFAGAAGAAMVHPLVGLIAGAIAFDRHRQYDRLQEQEADLLGIRLACDAGYDATGFLLLMQKFKEQNPTGISFLSTHPSPNQREAYLRTEANKCRTPAVSSTAPTLDDTIPSFLSDDERLVFKQVHNVAQTCRLFHSIHKTFPLSLMELQREKLIDDQVASGNGHSGYKLIYQSQDPKSGFTLSAEKPPGSGSFSSRFRVDESFTVQVLPARGAVGNSAAAQGDNSGIVWQKSKTLESGVVRLGLREKNGALGSYSVSFTIVSPDGKEYETTANALPFDWVEVSFPDDFGPSARKAAPGLYSSKCIVNGKVVVSDSFKYSP